MLGHSQLDARDLKVQGSTTVNPVVASALEILEREQGLRYQIDTLGGSTGGLNAVGQGTADVGMSSAFLQDTQRERFSGRDLRVIPIGYDAISLIVSRDVWESGVRALSPDDLRAIYEGRSRQWRDFGGANRRIVFFNKEPGRGTWSAFARWLYGSPEAAPPVSHPEVGSNAETRSKVAGTRGAISQLSTAWVDNETVFSLGIRLDDDSLLYPTSAALADGTYPLVRPLNLIVSGEPEGAVRMLIDFLLSERGQSLVREQGYLPVNAL